jgi:hypothetical protein
MLKDYSDPRHRPITAREIRDEEEAEERRLRDAEEQKTRDAENALTDTHRKLFELAKAEVLAGRPDPEFQMPEQIKTRRMTVAKALKFVEAESARFVEETPDYFRCDKNLKTMHDYLFAQGVQIPDAEAYKLAFDRCRYLGLLDEKPEPAPDPITVEPEPVETSPQTEELTDGFDIETGEPRKYTQREIWKMSSLEYKKAFKLWYGKDGVDRTPTFHRSRYQ